MLRYYEQQGLLNPVRADNGYRRYCSDAVTTVAQIRGLLDAGLPTDAIRQILPCAHGSEPTIDPCPEILSALAHGSEPTIDPCPEILSALAHERERLDERIRHLSASRDTLDRYLTATHAALHQD
jgi:DNA-binding transcriptional MerR regulator